VASCEEVLPLVHVPDLVGRDAIGTPGVVHAPPLRAGVAVLAEGGRAMSWKPSAIYRHRMPTFTWDHDKRCEGSACRCEDRAHIAYDLKADELIERARIGGAW
jgi:hypothetical protein